MTYIEGFIVAVPKANKEEYRRHAAGAAEQSARLNWLPIAHSRPAISPSNSFSAWAIVAFACATPS